MSGCSTHAFDVPLKPRPFCWGEAETFNPFNADLWNEHHAYEQRITGDGSDWGEIMRDAYDELMETACESCTTEQMEQLVGYIRAELGSGTCKPTEEDCCPYCGEDLVRCNVGIGELGGAVELDPPIYHNYCPNCGRKVEA